METGETEAAGTPPEWVVEGGGTDPRGLMLILHLTVGNIDSQKKVKVKYQSTDGEIDSTGRGGYIYVIIV